MIQDNVQMQEMDTFHGGSLVSEHFHFHDHAIRGVLKISTVLEFWKFQIETNFFTLRIH